MESTMHTNLGRRPSKPTSLFVSGHFSEDTILVPSDGILSVVKSRLGSKPLNERNGLWLLKSSFPRNSQK